jgi:hypothetical protein
MFLTRLAVVRPLTVLMGLLGLVIMGGVAYTFLKIDRLPPISIPFVSVNVSYTRVRARRTSTFSSSTARTQLRLHSRSNDASTASAIACRPMLASRGSIKRIPASSRSWKSR